MNLEQRFYIQHKKTKLCWSAETDSTSNVSISLSQNCTLQFIYTLDKNILEFNTKKCVQVNGDIDVNDSPIVLSSVCEGTNTIWNWENGFWKLAGNGKCIHLFNSHLPAHEGKKLVLFEGCRNAVNVFQRVQGKYTIYN